MENQKTPEWVKRLPEWAKYDKETGKVDVSSDEGHAIYLKELGFGGTTQAEIECARACLENDLLKVTGPGLILRLVPTDEQKYMLDKYPVGEQLNSRVEYGRICKAREQLSAKATRH